MHTDFNDFIHRCKKYSALKRLVYALTVVALALMIESCVAVKSSSKELSGLGKAYHNTTAHYNGYFNADEILATTMLSMEQEYKDNYTQILPVYAYMGIDNPKAAAPVLDEAVKKVTKVAALHPKSDWVDDCYLLAGKAHFLKQDFETAEQTLRYLTAEFSPEKAKLKKAVAQNVRSGSSTRAPMVGSDGQVLTAKEREKVREKAKKDKEKLAKDVAKARKKYNADVARARKQGKPLPAKPEILNRTKTGTSTAGATTKSPEQIQKEKARKEAEEAKREKDYLKKKPAYYEGVLWLARTLIERENEDLAFRTLTELENDPNTPNVVRAQLAPLLGHFYIKKKQYEEAVKPLEEAVERADDSKIKARYNYILAQLHQRAGRWNEAYAGFEKVASSSVNYEMQFNARLNMAQNSWLSGKGSAESATAQLEKMLKDAKNQEYRDRVYYALANVALKNNNKPKAIEYLTLSVRSAGNNPAQVTESYYTLAQLYFDEEKFIQTKNYLDSTLTIMDKKDDRLKSATILRDNLVDIAKNLSTIQLQDSLLTLSALSDAELKKRAAKIKKDKDEQRLRALENSKVPENNIPNPGAITGRPLIAGTQASTFWAYDEKEVKQGKREFQRNWGERVLEDNWRRSEKRGGSNEIVVDDPANANKPTTDPDAPEPENEVLIYLGPVPRTDAERRSAEVKVIDAMYKLGVLYYDKLENFDKTVKTLEGLNTRFGRHNFELNSWYYLYLAHRKLNHAEQAQAYYDKIVGGYPTSTFARILQDPNYAAEFLNEERKVNVYYDEAYAAFKKGNYQDAFKMCLDSKVRFGAENKLASRFALLAALCTGNLQGADAYKSALNEVIARYPTSDEQKRAKEILRLLGGAGAQLPGDQERTDEENVRFRPDENAIHFILVALDNNANLDNAKNKISDYNRNFHKLDKITITNLAVGDDEKTRKLLVILRRFENKGAAMKYYDGVMKNRAQFMDANVNYQLLPISMDNYRSVLRDKTLDGYAEFFEANYLK
jgi:tetratricopeptide (TPR) repeat protein